MEQIEPAICKTVENARHLSRATSAEAAVRAGTETLGRWAMANIKKLLGYDQETMLWIEKELKKNGDLIFDILTKDQLKQWHRYEERKNK